MTARYSFRDKLADHFKRHPGVWLDGAQLEAIAGKYAWRTRISDCRTQLGMTIENRVRTGAMYPSKHAARYKVSEYRYVPPVASVPMDAHDLNEWTLR